MSLYPADFRPSFRWPFTPRAANENCPLSLRWQHMVERAKFVRAWVRKMEKRALRLVRP